MTADDRSDAENEIARLIGWALHQFGLIEGNVTEVFRFVLSLEDHDLARSILNSVTNFRQRLGIMSAAVDRWGVDREEPRIWKALVQKLNTLQWQRNELAHGRILATPTGGAALYPFVMQTENGMTSKAALGQVELRKRIDDFKAMSDAVAWLVSSVAAPPLRLVVLPENNPPLIQEVRIALGLWDGSARSSPDNPQDGPRAQT